MTFLRKWFRKISARKAPEASSPLLSEMMREEEKSPGGISLWVGKASDVGRVRERNEDAFLTLESTFMHDSEVLPFGLFIVADGMGGHESGQIASALSTQVVAEEIMRRVYLPFLRGDALNAGAQPVNEALTAAISAANEAVHQAVPDAGTTLTCALVLGTNAYIAHVGDSRAYLLRQGHLEQLTQDHSLVARLIELGQISPEEALDHPQRNVLYRAVGQVSNLEVDTYLQSLPRGSSLLLCSDGLWGAVPQEEITRIITAAPSPQIACQRLVAAANARGGEDNITVVLIAVRS